MNPPGCTEPCGPNGTVEWRRHVEVSQAHGGTCTGGLSKTEACNRFACPVDCVGGWGEPIRTWTTRKKQCNEYEYKITVNKAGTGAACPFEDGEKKTECNNNNQRSPMAFSSDGVQ